MKAVAQEHLMSCSVACVASLCKISYNKALTLFKNESFASTRGYSCKEICAALKRENKNYSLKKISPKTKNLLKKEGVIVFVSELKDCAEGHYLLKTKKGWMDSWINFPLINPIKTGFRKKLPGKPKWIIFPVHD